jgi:phospholipid/cholesterol/gamma-HCH transport system substrate-binding protein
MQKRYLAAAGAFVILSVILFGAILFLLGDRNKAFTHHVDFYTELTDINGIEHGAKVRVSGFEAGAVNGIELPSHASGKFRIKLHVDNKLHALIRTDSQVTVESDGLVGDKFLLIHEGTDQAPEATAGTTLPSKEPIELSAVIGKVDGVIDLATGTIKDVQGKVDGALDSITGTVNNTNGLVTSIRSGKGTIGMLLNDDTTAKQIKATVANAQQASANLQQTSLQVQQLVTDLQRRNLTQKADDTLASAQHAVAQLDQSSQQVNEMLTVALAPSTSGQTAGENLRDSLSNINTTTANVAEDTEALKHEFLFRGFFKKRGFYSLQDLSPEQYRNDPYFRTHDRQRIWLDGQAFATGSGNSEFLTPAGKQQIDQMVGNLRDTVVDAPMIIEGYASRVQPADQIALSRARSLLVTHYLQDRFKLHGKNLGVMPLNDTAPAYSGKTNWDGACIVILGTKK